MDRAAIQKKLASWYDLNRRDLPWRRTRDPYAIWISEIMLQQTRVAAVIPYYRRFLERFPTVEALAAAAGDEVLAYWSGLGYYSRPRNLQRAARQIVDLGGFPQDYAGIRALAGVGDYTAAAVASIAFGQPHAAVDGNVKRVLMRLANSSTLDLRVEAERFLDVKDPGRWNQALMELGAVICFPRDPSCAACPVSRHCGAYRHGTALALPPKRAKAAAVRKRRQLLVFRRRGRTLLAPSPRVKGFWDLPETGTLPPASYRLQRRIGSFRHSITNSQYLFEVWLAVVRGTPSGCRWWRETEMPKVLISAATKKALRCLEGAES